MLPLTSQTSRRLSGISGQRRGSKNGSNGRSVLEEAASFGADMAGMAKSRSTLVVRAIARMVSARIISRLNLFAGTSQRSHRQRVFCLTIRWMNEKVAHEMPEMSKRRPANTASVG